MHPMHTEGFTGAPTGDRASRVARVARAALPAAALPVTALSVAALLATLVAPALAPRTGGAAARDARQPRAAATPDRAQERLRVVTSLPTYAAIAREVAGDRAEVRAIARGDQDPHFVNPRPSYARMIREADLFVTTGLDLELWVPGLLDRANNPRVVEEAPGHVVAYSGIELRDVPASVSRTGGDIHVFGNPHVHTDPINAITIAGNIVQGLKRVDAEGSAEYDARLVDFRDRVLRRTFGERLVELLGGETLLGLARADQFWRFAEGQTYRGRPLTEYVGGWLAEGAPFRGRRMVCYHKNWAYFSARFQVPCAMYVEPKPGIPPAPGHVRDVMAFMRSENISVLFAANYFSRSQVERVAERTGATAVIVPEHVGGAEGVDDYFALVDLWVSRLAEAFRSAAALGPEGGPERPASARDPDGAASARGPAGAARAAEREDGAG